MIWVGFAFMTLTAVSFAVWPLLGKSKGTADARDGTSAVLVDQLDEVARDLDRGVITTDEASAARLEIKRRILALSRKAVAAEPQPLTKGNGAVYLAAVFVPILAIGYYSVNGAPNVPNLVSAERQVDREQDREIANLAQKLFDRLEQDPNGGPSEGWVLLGQTYMRMGRFDDAARAFETASIREDASSATWSRFAEAMIMAEDGFVTPRAETAIRKSLELDPANPAATFYQAVSMEQAGDTADARALLLARLNDAEEFAPWMETYVAKANELGKRIGVAPVSLASVSRFAAPGPSVADVAAAGNMTKEDRSAFIRSMVERLADRLAEEPEDLDGWLRLANAYSVLGESENAVSAYQAADALLQGAGENDPRRLKIQRELSKLKGKQP